MTEETKFNTGELLRENRMLRDALNELLDEIENSNSMATIDTSKVRNKVPSQEDNRESLEPPWVRDGFDTKQEWLDNR